MSYKTFVNRNYLPRLLTAAFLIFSLLAVTVVTSPTSYAREAECSNPPCTNQSRQNNKNDDNCDSNTKNCCNGVATAIDYGCTKSNDEVKGNPIFSLLLAVINFLAIGVGVAVVGGVVYGAIRYIAANGNGGKVQEAIKIMTNAVLGLVLFAFMYAIINFLVPGGVFN